jgi:hypothetical protein
MDNYNLGLYKSMIYALKLSAASYDEQIKCMPSFVIVTDEISTTFGEAFLLAEQLLEAGIIDEKIYRKLNDLDNWFSINDENEDLVSLKSLRDSSYWQRVRYMAKSILDDMGVKPPFILPYG